MGSTSNYDSVRYNAQGQVISRTTSSRNSGGIINEAGGVLGLLGGGLLGGGFGGIGGQKTQLYMTLFGGPVKDLIGTGFNRLMGRTSEDDVRSAVNENNLVRIKTDTDVRRADREAGNIGRGGNDNFVLRAEVDGAAERAEIRRGVTTRGSVSGSAGRAGSASDVATGEPEGTNTRSLSTSGQEDSAIMRFIKALMALMNKTDDTPSNDVNRVSIKLNQEYNKGSAAEGVIKQLEVLAGSQGAELDGKISAEELKRAQEAVKKSGKDIELSDAGNDTFIVGSKAKSAQELTATR